MTYLKKELGDSYNIDDLTASWSPAALTNGDSYKIDETDELEDGPVGEEPATQYFS